MSQAQLDSYLAAQRMPAQELVLDPKWHNIRLVTPIGRFAYIHVDKPHAIPSQDGSPPKPKYSATLLMAPGTQENPIVLDLYRAVCMVADAHWPAIQRPDPNNPGSIVTVPGSKLFGVDQKLGGVHYPLRAGDDNYTREPAKFALWRGLYFINCGMSPVTKSGAEMKPVCIDEQGMACSPDKFYPGCYGRMQVTVAPFENSGNRGVTFYLDAVQFARHGERIVGSDRGAAAQKAFAGAGAITGDIGQPPPGFGPNAATPGSTPPGVPFGFAAPPPQVAAAPAAPGFAAPQPQAGFNPAFAAPQPGAGAGQAFRPPGA